MKLKQFIIEMTELQDYLDKYEEKIKFILFNTSPGNISYQVLLIIDVA